MSLAALLGAAKQEDIKKITIDDDPPVIMWDSNAVFSKRPIPHKPLTPPYEHLHGLTRGKLLECKSPGCGRQFKSKSHLVRHERMHTGYLLA